MNLIYFGHSCFKSEFARNATVVTDSYTGVGYEMPGVASVVTCSRHFNRNCIGKVNQIIVKAGACNG